MKAPTTPMRLAGPFLGLAVLKLASSGLWLNRLRTNRMAATTSTTASTSLASDFLVEVFVRDLVLIPVPFVPQNITRNSVSFPRPFRAYRLLCVGQRELAVLSQVKSSAFKLS